MTTSEREEAVKRVVDYWQTLSAARVSAISEVYTEDAYFRDPFNEVTGLDKLKHIFSDMFVRLHEPKFTITETIHQDNRVLMVWDFTYRIKTLKPELDRKIHGSSLIRFGADGRVNYHRDYWDAAGELYEQLPVIGALMRWLKKRMG